MKFTKEQLSKKNFTELRKLGNKAKVKFRALDEGREEIYNSDWNAEGSPVTNVKIEEITESFSAPIIKSEPKKPEPIGKLKDFLKSNDAVVLQEYKNNEGIITPHKQYTYAKGINPLVGEMPIFSGDKIWKVNKKKQPVLEEVD